MKNQIPFSYKGKTDFNKDLAVTHGLVEVSEASPNTVFLHGYECQLEALPSLKEQQLVTDDSKVIQSNSSKELGTVRELIKVLNLRKYLANNLWPGEFYIFKTETEKVTIDSKAMAVTAGMMEPIIEIYRKDKKEGDVLIWSHGDWIPEEYQLLCCRFFEFIDSSMSGEVSVDALNHYHMEGYSPVQMANSLFDGEQGDFKLVIVSLENGYFDIEVQGIGNITRYRPAGNAHEQESYNVYHGESSKSSAEWKDDVLSSLKAFLID
ncbi:TPA: hypothetical protein I7730_15840 [Vibrio vulnificus]|uniref:Uncharacterized protein n=1 Tax=Vibrio vulnificus TaxID=672 RepID=A0A8H9TG69_VIBVL|nr:hypothetical protein [Vibrio vulnificus]HAS8541254.1 hypothetical protein [Vibrio vulnificus]